VALLVHLALLMLGSPMPELDQRALSPLRVRRIATLSAAEPSPPAKTVPRAEPLAETQPTSAANRQRLSGAVREEPEETPTPESETSTRARGPRRMDLFPQSVIGKIAAPPPPEPALAGDALAQQRLDGWARELKRANQPALDVTPGVYELGRQLAQWFLPQDAVWKIAGVKKRPLHELILPKQLTELPEKLARHAEDGRLLEFLNGSSSPYWDSPARRSIERFEEFSHTRIAGGGCFGACGDGHAQAHLVTLVQVDHDISGLPSKWRVAESSGVGAFDDAALAAVADTADWVGAMEQDRPPQRSQWSFAATAYQWPRGELLLDPQFKPPGKPLESTSDWKAQTTVTRTVRLVAVLYRGETAD
jgi:hypothetical protein